MDGFQIRWEYEYDILEMSDSSCHVQSIQQYSKFSFSIILPMSVRSSSDTADCRPRSPLPALASSSSAAMASKPVLSYVKKGNII